MERAIGTQIIPEVRIMACLGGVLMNALLIWAGVCLISHEQLTGWWIHGEYVWLLLVGVSGLVICTLGSFFSLVYWVFLKGTNWMGKEKLLLLLFVVMEFFLFLVWPMVFLFLGLGHMKWKNWQIKNITIFLLTILKIFLFELIYAAVYFLIYWSVLIVFVKVPSHLAIYEPFSGTGSMYPTIPKGMSLTLDDQRKEIVGRYPMYEWPRKIQLGSYVWNMQDISHGDIVSFSNEKVHHLLDSPDGSLVKRVIGLEGDVIRLQGGVVYLNGKPLKEPYIAAAQSSFGGESLGDCKDLRIPKGSLFVMGDNRLNSADSRFELGLVSEEDVHAIMPWSSQLGFVDNGWHDPARDLDGNQKLHFDAMAYLAALNEKRAQSHLSLLVFNKTLSNSAQLRGEQVVKSGDYSLEASESGYPMSQSAKDAGYWNVMFGELVYPGYVDALQMLESQFGERGDGEFFLQKDWDDIGIANVQADVLGCPRQAVVIQLGGYKPAEYAQSMIDSWKRALANLESSLPAWKELLSTDYYKRHTAEVDSLLNLYQTRITRMRSLVKKFDNHEWLSEEEQRYVEEDESLATESNALANTINEQLRSGEY